MSSNNRPTEKELAQEYFTGLIGKHQVQPAAELHPQMARLIHDLVQTEQASHYHSSAEFEAIRQRIRHQIEMPADRNLNPVATLAFSKRVEQVRHENIPGFSQPRKVIWPRFIALSAMTATIVLVIGLLVLSLAATRTPETTPGVGVSPVSVQTATAQPTAAPTPTLRPKPTQNIVDDKLNPKIYLEKALVDVAKSISLDPAALQKQLKNGMTLTEIAQKQGFTQEQLKTIMLDSFKVQINADKNSRILTQSEADQLLKVSSNFIDAYLSATPATLVAR